MIKASEAFKMTWEGEILPIHIWGEVMEVFDAFPDLNHVWLEMRQVGLYILFFVYRRFGIDLPIWGLYDLIEEDFSRFKVWEKILSIYGIQLHMSLFSDGNNWRRPEKIVSTLNRAGITISVEEATQLVGELK